MNCKKIQELILTDYIDNEMDEKHKLVIDEHIARCPECKKFYAIVKEEFSGVFDSAARLTPDESVWVKIKENIVQKEEKRLFAGADLLERIKQMFRIPKPAFSIASLIVVISIAAVMTPVVINRVGLNGSEQGQAELADYSMDISADASNTGETGFGTQIEEYFL